MLLCYFLMLKEVPHHLFLSLLATFNNVIFLGDMPTDSYDAAESDASKSITIKCESDIGKLMEL